MKILYGKKIADEKIKALKERIKNLSQKPFLAVILVGNDFSSKFYVSIKEKKALELGLGFKKFIFKDAVMQERIVYLIKKLNKDKNISGILVQLPLPEHLNTARIIKNIAPEKDVDGLREDSKFTSPTIQAVIDLLRVALSEANFLKVKKSFTIAFFTGKHFKKKLIKSLDENFKGLALESKNSINADVIVVAKGQINFLKADMIKKGAIVIDVGINTVKSVYNNLANQDKISFDKIIGDSDKSVQEKASILTPVPGGVGPLTIFNLFQNLINNK
ncbi:MAG: Bifunctional protein FolD [Candidatus Magasanikbacteria bacterium GW2011_GWC2_41_17]|uniref:Bifunctional protein FolD n=1 Tax=Candidatus Magasanikbacteria bacterium GW2011_GWC2_41_17 TaxID=1619048 RepID=A0A0G0YBN5_9BACT|nr:MAG: Bifunctional protein FolD [Candidatus Magasanikbacteria bacterium GW2011_GWC2_41_17]